MWSFQRPLKWNASTFCVKTPQMLFYQTIEREGTAAAYQIYIQSETEHDPPLHV